MSATKLIYTPTTFFIHVLHVHTFHQCDFQNVSLTHISSFKIPMTELKIPKKIVIVSNPLADSYESENYTYNY